MAVAAVGSCLVVRWNSSLVVGTLCIAALVMTVAAWTLLSEAAWKMLVDSRTPCRFDSVGSTFVVGQRLPQIPRIPEGYQSQQVVLHLHCPRTPVFAIDVSGGRRVTGENGATDYLARR